MRFVSPPDIDLDHSPIPLFALRTNPVWGETCAMRLARNARRLCCAFTQGEKRHTKKFLQAINGRLFELARRATPTQSHAPMQWPCSRWLSWEASHPSQPLHRPPPAHSAFSQRAHRRPKRRCDKLQATFRRPVTRSAFSQRLHLGPGTRSAFLQRLHLGPLTRSESLQRALCRGKGHCNKLQATFRRRGTRSA